MKELVDINLASYFIREIYELPPENEGAGWTLFLIGNLFKLN